MKKKVILAGAYRHYFEDLLNEDEEFQKTGRRRLRVRRWKNSTVIRRLIQQRYLLSEEVYVVVPSPDGDEDRIVVNGVPMGPYEEEWWKGMQSLVPRIRPIFATFKSYPPGENLKWFRIGQSDYQELAIPEIPSFDAIEERFYEPLVASTGLRVWNGFYNMTPALSRRLSRSLFRIFVEKRDPDLGNPNERLLVAYLRNFAASMVRLAREREKDRGRAYGLVEVRWFEDIAIPFASNINVIYRALSESLRLDADLLMSHVDLSHVELDSGEVRDQVLKSDHRVYAAIKREVRIPAPSTGREFLLSEIEELRQKHLADVRAVRATLMSSRKRLLAGEWSEAKEARQRVAEAKQWLSAAAGWEESITHLEYLVAAVDAIREVGKLPIKILMYLGKLPAKLVKKRYAWSIQLPTRLP